MVDLRGGAREAVVGAHDGSHVDPDGVEPAPRSTAAISRELQSSPRLATASSSARVSRRPAAARSSPRSAPASARMAGIAALPPGSSCAVLSCRSMRGSTASSRPRRHRRRGLSSARNASVTPARADTTTTGGPGVGADDPRQPLDRRRVGDGRPAEFGDDHRDSPVLPPRAARRSGPLVRRRRVRCCVRGSRSAGRGWARPHPTDRHGHAAPALDVEPRLRPVARGGRARLAASATTAAWRRGVRRDVRSTASACSGVTFRRKPTETVSMCPSITATRLACALTAIGRRDFVPVSAPRILRVSARSFPLRRRCTGSRCLRYRATARRGSPRRRPPASSTRRSSRRRTPDATARARA